MVSESVNMATVPRLMTREEAGEGWQEEDKEKTQDRVPQSAFEVEEAPLSPASPPRTLIHNKHRDSEVSQIITSPSSETTGDYKGEKHGVQTREKNLLLGLQSLNCSTELLESVEKFLS